MLHAVLRTTALGLCVTWSRDLSEGPTSVTAPRSSEQCFLQSDLLILEFCASLYNLCSPTEVLAKGGSQEELPGGGRLTIKVKPTKSGKCFEVMQEHSFRRGSAMALDSC